MVNARRGEIEARLDGRSYALCLTLGALAELESAFGNDDMIALACRFEQGRISAKDCIRIVGAGLRGAGHDVCDEAVSRMRSDNGAAGFVDIVARLLKATFGDGAETLNPEGSTAQGGPGPGRGVEGAAASTAPFPGTR